MMPTQADVAALALPVASEQHLAGETGVAAMESGDTGRLGQTSRPSTVATSLASQAIFHGRKWAGRREGKIRLVTIASIPRASAGMLAAPIRFQKLNNSRDFR